jgi:hypothetical protein
VGVDGLGRSTLLSRPAPQERARLHGELGGQDLPAAALVTALPTA